jgi:oligopeptide transport system substrate-binding protein
MRRIFQLSLIFLSALLCTFAITPGTSRAATTLRLTLPPISNLDPVALPKTDLAARDLAENIFVGLVRHNPKTGAFDKMLAKDWQVSQDGLTWTFTLRTDVQWVRINGEKVEAVRPISPADFVAAFRRACDQVAPNPTSPTVFIIAGCVTVNNANPVQVNDVFIARNLKVIASGADKLEITFAYSAAYIPALLALPEFRPIPREIVSKNPLGWATQASTLVTSGPYVIQRWEGASLQLVRNPLWPDPFEGNIETISVNDSSGTPDAGRMPGNLRYRQSVLMLGFSLERPGVSNEGFRRALALAIDRTAIAPLAGGQPTAGILAQPNAGDLAADVAAAKAALATTPYGGCTRLPDKFDIAVDNSAGDAQIAQALIGGWNKALGCNTASFNVRPYDPARLMSIAHASVNVDENQKGAPRSHLWLVRWSPDYADPHAWTGDAIHCDYGFFQTGLACGSADELVDKASREGTDAAPYLQAEAVWFGKTGTFPVVPLAALYTNVKADTVSGLPADGADNAPFRFDQWTVK